MTSFNENPELIEPVPVVIESIDTVSTPYSGGVSGRRETVNHVVRTEFTIDAQVVFGNSDMKFKTTQLGASEEFKGYILVRLSDLRDLGKDIKRGDRVIQMDTIALSTPLYIMHSLGDITAQFTSIGFTLVRFLFTDRNPVG